MAGFFYEDNNMIITGNTIFEVWKDSLSYLVRSDSVVPTERNLDTYEILNSVLVIEDPLSNLDELLAFERKRGIIYSETSRKKYWDVVRQKLNKYPKSSVNQLDFISQKLNNSPYNRHGYASIWSPHIDTSSSYPSCIIGIYFMVRDNKLNMTAILRSNDAWGQALNDIYELAMIQKEMALRLQLKVGSYTHFAMSYHLYTKDKMDAQLFLSEETQNGN